MLPELKLFPQQKKKKKKRLVREHHFEFHFCRALLIPKSFHRCFLFTGQWGVTVCDLIIILFTWFINFWLSWLLFSCLRVKSVGCRLLIEGKFCSSIFPTKTLLAHRLLVFFSQNRAVLLCGIFMRFFTEFLTILRNDHACSHIVTFHCSVNKKHHLATKLYRNETQNAVTWTRSFLYRNKL